MGSVRTMLVALLALWTAVGPVLAGGTACCLVCACGEPGVTNRAACCATPALSADPPACGCCSASQSTADSCCVVDVAADPDTDGCPCGTCEVRPAERAIPAPESHTHLERTLAAALLAAPVSWSVPVPVSDRAAPPRPAWADAAETVRARLCVWVI